MFDRQLLVDLSDGSAGRSGPTPDDEELGRRFWESLNNAEVDRYERLFFEVYGQALQGRAWALPLLDGIVDGWIEPPVGIFVAQGAPAESARVDARLTIAVSRGLLLDVLATGDRVAVDDSMTSFMDLLTNQPVVGRTPSA